MIDPNHSTEANVMTHYLDLREAKLRESIMSELSDKIAEVARSQDEAIARVMADVNAQQAEIDELRNRVTAPEDIAALDAIRAKNAALDPRLDDTLPDEPTDEPTVEPAP